MYLTTIDQGLSRGVCMYVYMYVCYSDPHHSAMLRVYVCGGYCVTLYYMYPTRAMLIGIFRGPLLGGPLSISLYVLS